MAIKNAILKAKIADVVYEVLVKTNAANVYVDDTTTLAAKLTSILADIATKASTEEMTTALAAKANATHTHEQSEINGLTDLLNTLATSASVTSAIDALRQELLGDTPVEAYNTFTELAEYIAEHQEVSDALTAAIGQKADKATTLAGYGIADAYTKTEVDTKVEEALAAATGGESAADVLTALNNYKSSNDLRVTTIEDDYLKAADKTELENDITTGDTTTLNSAKAYADGLASNYDAAGSATQALTDAKAYADGLNTTMDTRVAAIETNVTTANVTEWNSKSTIFYAAEQPATLAEGDLWVQLVD